MIGHTGRGRAVSLRRAWRAMLAQLLAIIVAVTVVAVALHQHELRELTTTTGHLREETAALVALDRALLESVGPMTVVLYRAGTDEEVADGRFAYRQAGAEVSAAFGRAEAALHTDHERELLADARVMWAEIDGVVRSSTTQWSDEELHALLTSGQDPFRPMWAVYADLDMQRAEVLTAAVDDMGHTVRATEANHRLALAAFAVALVAAVAFAVAAGRRLSRTVRRPLEELCDATSRLGGVDGERPIDLPEAVVEIQQLAAALNHSDRSLRRSTGLLRSQAYTDGLTSLPNRKAFGEALDAALGERHGGRATVLFIDLDDFKDVNDTQGHAAGDALLQIVASRLLAAVRDGDLVARLGGDEFGVLTEIHDDGQAAVSVAERILRTMQAPVLLDGHQVFVGCSIGIAVAHGETGGRDGDTLLADADFAMYMAKGQGKNRYELHSAVMHAEMLSRAQLRFDRAKAAEAGELVLHYQPILDLDSGQLVGFEALVRWDHPNRGLLQPDAFIPIAEDTGMIIDIGWWVLEEACRTLADLQSSDTELVMTVNVSAKQLASGGFAREALRTAATHGVSPNRIVVEMTEETATLNTGPELETLVALRDQGFQIALDDFGTGFSSLRYLGEIPVNIIKIDRAFIAPDKSSMLESIIALADRLGLRVIAEGIEQQSDLDRLRTYGSMDGQGFLFAKAMPASELDAFRATTEERRVPVT